MVPTGKKPPKTKYQVNRNIVLVAFFYLNGICLPEGSYLEIQTFAEHPGIRSTVWGATETRRRHIQGVETTVRVSDEYKERYKGDDCL